MSNAIAQALEAIEATCSASALYGEDHPVVAQRASEASAKLRAAGSVTISYFTDRVLADRAPLPISRESLLERFVTRQNCNAFVIPADVDDMAIRRLARAITQDETIAIAPFRLSHARIGDGAATSDKNMTRVLEAVPDLLTAIRGERPIPPAVVDGIVAEILASATVSAGSLIPLAALKHHDEYTFVHTVNVAILASALADSVGLSGQSLHDLTAAALLHDVGKVVIPKSILCKPGNLDDKELAVVRRHPSAGAALLYAQPGVPPMAVLVAYEHHQHLDGGGYPAGAGGAGRRVRAHRPSLASQIVQVADVHDALRTHRPYRAAMTEMEAVETMHQMAGRQFDPQLFEQFLRVLPTCRRDAPPPELALAA